MLVTSELIREFKGIGSLLKLYLPSGNENKYGILFQNQRTSQVTINHLPRDD